MTDLNSSRGVTASWLDPDSEENELRKYLSTLRHRGWLIVATVVLALAVAAAYVETATPVYQAQSSLLVSSVPTGGSIPSNIPGLLYQSADPTRDIQTAATIVDSITTATAVKSSLRLSASPAKILSEISVQPVSDSNVLAVTGSASTAVAAANLANAFAQQTVRVRTAKLDASLDRQIAAVKAQLAAAGAAGTTTATTSATSLAQQLAALQGLRSAALPDMSVSALAAPPPGRSSPRATLSLGAGLVVGLVLGILAVLALEAFDLTLRREDQLKALFRLPILARIPREGSGRSWRLRRSTEPRTPDSLTFPTLEAFRTLRAMALASRLPGQPVPRSILVTSAAPSEGKTTTALNLAASIAASGSSVILIEGDLRRPAIGNAVRLLAAYDVTGVLTGEVPLSQALVSSKRFPGVRFLLAEGIRSQGTSGDALFLPTVRRMLQDAQALADFVIVDSPPLLAVIDALELAREADSVLMVAQLGQTNLQRLAALGSLLAEAHIDPAGIVLIGAELPGGPDVYGYQDHERRLAAEDELRPPGGVPRGTVDDDDGDRLEPEPSREARLREGNGVAARRESAGPWL
jgi:Mrp family chromosome partitioning ATPase/capsular polysaccharide biosynthesis protein